MAKIQKIPQTHDYDYIKNVVLESLKKDEFRHKDRHNVYFDEFGGLVSVVNSVLSGSNETLWGEEYNHVLDAFWELEREGFINLGQKRFYGHGDRFDIRFLSFPYFHITENLLKIIKEEDERENRRISKSKNINVLIYKIKSLPRSFLDFSIKNIGLIWGFLKWIISIVK